MEQFCQKHTDREQTTIISWLFPACWKTWRQMRPALRESVSPIVWTYTPRPLIPWKSSGMFLHFPSVWIHSLIHSIHVETHFASFHPFKKKKNKLKQRQLYTAIHMGVCLYSWVYLSRHFVNYICKYI